MQSSLHVDGTLVPGIPFSAPPLLSGILCLNVSVPLQKVFVATIKTNHGQQQPGWTTIGNWRRNTFVHLMIRGQDACQMWQQRIWMHIVGCLHEKGGRTHKRGSKEWRGGRGAWYICLTEMESRTLGSRFPHSGIQV